VLDAEHAPGLRRFGFAEAEPVLQFPIGVAGYLYYNFQLRWCFSTIFGPDESQGSTYPPQTKAAYHIVSRRRMGRAG
jgi:hypothetical protein